MVGRFHNNRGWYGNSGKPEEATEKPETNIIPSLSPRGVNFRQELLTKILPWQEINDSLDNFPYFIEEHAKSLLVECVASNLKYHKLRTYGACLQSSSGRILLRTIPGAELYRERLVSAIAREMKVPLLKLDGHRGFYEKLDGHRGCNEEYEEEDYRTYQSYNDEENYNKETIFKAGDRVKYAGTRSISFEEVNNRTLSNGQRGEVYEVKGNTVAVVFNICGLKAKQAQKDDKNAEILRQSLVVWLHAEDVHRDHQTRTHDSYIAMEVLYEVLESQQTMIAYFPDSFPWPSGPSYSSSHDDKATLMKLKKIFDQLPEGVVMICAENNSQEELRQLGKLPKPLMDYFKWIPVPQRYGDSELHKLFTNSVWIKPPKDEDLANTFIEQIEKDWSTVVSKDNLKRMHEVLNSANLSCVNLEYPIIENRILTREEVEKIVGWALNHYCSSCPRPCVNDGKLHIPYDSMKLASSRFMTEADYTLLAVSNKNSKNIKDLASEYGEERLVSVAVHLDDIDVKFDDVGATDNVKKVLYQTIILPMRRPELFSHRNLLKPCKGILLYGPPGTGKTLIAKALAKESGANFINITASTFESMNHRALFSYARKLAPVVIFLDEVDSMLGDRGHNEYDTEMNDFISAWDGLDSEERQRILVIGATNRPFDLDIAVIHRMPRRIYVGLPDLENRSKILKLFLNKENLESGFSFEQLAEATDGYSGSDLKNLYVAAAYRPIEELLEQESKGVALPTDGVPALRPLTLNDFIHSISEVRPSVASNASSIVKLGEWKEQYGEGERC